MSVPGRPPEAGDVPGPVEHDGARTHAVHAPGPGTWGLTVTEPWYLGPLYDLISDVMQAGGA